MARRRTKGILTTMRAAPSRKPKRKKRESVFIKLLRWFGAVVLGAVILTAVVMFGIRMFYPRMGEETLTEVVEVMVIEDDPEILNEEVGEVAAALVELEHGTIRLGLTSETVASVGVGTKVRVTYVYTPLTRRMLLDDWEVAEEPDEPATTP
jgi:hypothetical protein